MTSATDNGMNPECLVAPRVEWWPRLWDKVTHYSWPYGAVWSWSSAECLLVAMVVREMIMNRASDGLDIRWA
jgi:hypothetical protein